MTVKRRVKLTLLDGGDYILNLTDESRTELTESERIH